MKKTKSNNFLSILFLVCAIVFAVLFVIEKKKNANLESTNIKSGSEMEEVNQKAGDAHSDANTSNQLSKLQSWDIKRFQKKGLKNPEDDIIESLLKQSHLIKFEPHAGVTWRFDKNETILLSNRWVFTKFDEGHMLGSMLLEYTVNNGLITWEVISQYLD
jgi:hypothetical protein